jgi:ribosomal protein L37AE/L43A
MSVTLRGLLPYNEMESGETTMEQIDPLLDGEFGYSFTTTSGSECNPSREFEEEFALVRYEGELADLPEHFKRNVTVRRAEQFEEGEMLMLKDGHVTTFDHEFDHFRVRAGDRMKKYEVDLEDMGVDDLYCPLCGNKIWHKHMGQNFISCNKCQAGIDVYGKGEDIVFSLGP